MAAAKNVSSDGALLNDVCCVLPSGIERGADGWDALDVATAACGDGALLLVCCTLAELPELPPDVESGPGGLAAWAVAAEHLATVAPSNAAPADGLACGPTGALCVATELAAGPAAAIKPVADPGRGGSGGRRRAAPTGGGGALLGGGGGTLPGTEGPSLGLSATGDRLAICNKSRSTCEVSLTIGFIAS